MPSMEDIYKDHTAALIRHADSLDAFVKASGKSGGTAQSTDDKPTRTRRTKEQIAEDEAKAAREKASAGEGAGRSPAKDESVKNDDPTIYDIVKTFLDYGDDSREDEDERDRRGAFVKKMLRHFEVDRARDIPEKNFSKVKRWLKLFKDDPKVDFDND